jgi:hypothetical protein
VATPPRTSTVADAPRNELGAQLRALSHGPIEFSKPVLDERETARDLRWPQSNKTYASMLNDAQMGGLYRGATLPIRAYRWWLDPNGARPETVERISRNYNLPIGPTGEFNRRRGQRRFNFDQHLEDALRAIALGHYPFEQVVDARRDGDPDVNGGWVAHLRKLAARPPHTVTKITPARDGGLESITVPALAANRDITNLVGTVDLPVDRLVMYVWDREGANWRGRSMFRDCYRPWKLKDRVLRVGAINIERAGGVPYIEAPEGADPKDLEKLHILATQFRVGMEAGAALPHGAQLKFAAANGGKDAIDYVRLQNEEMARAWLMMWMTAGQTSSGHGSTEQTGTLVDYFRQVQAAIAKWFAMTFDEHVIEDDVEWNEGPEEEYAPLLRFTPQGDPLAATADELDDAQREGALPADSAVAAAVKRETPGGRRRPTPAAASEAAATDRLPDRPLHRDPFEHEVTAATDFAALETTHQDAVTQLVAAWQEVRAEQIDELVGQVEQAEDLDALTQITATTRGAEVLREILTRVATEAVAQALDEAEEQGADLDAPDMDALEQDTEARADATATLLAQALSDAARRRAVALAGDHAQPADVAQGVRQHLDSLSDSYLEEQFTGAVTEAQNGGRRAVFEQAEDADGTAILIYASALLDPSTCEPCREDDGKEYATLAEFAADFPTGGNRRCKGGRRCRCTGVAVYAEAAPSVQ